MEEPRSASEGRLQLDGGFLKNEALFWTQKQLSIQANGKHSSEALRGYPKNVPCS